MEKKKKKKNRFLLRTKENAKMNQYWYSQNTIEVIVNEIEYQKPKHVAFLSTPSIFFSLNSKELMSNSVVFDFDKKRWGKKKGFAFYDYNKPEDIPSNYHKHFDFIIIDPPFITKEVWELYTKACKLIGKKEGFKIIATTISENKDMMKEFLKVQPQVFKPSIPNLVYQYNLYCNFKSNYFNNKNEELLE